MRLRRLHALVRKCKSEQGIELSFQESDGCSLVVAGSGRGGVGWVDAALSEKRAAEFVDLPVDLRAVKATGDLGSDLGENRFIKFAVIGRTVLPAKTPTEVVVDGNSDPVGITHCCSPAVAGAQMGLVG